MMRSTSLLAAAAATVCAGLALGLPARAQHAGHPPMPGQQPRITVTLEGEGEPVVVEVPLAVGMASAPAEPDQRIELPGESPPPLRVTRYLPQARLSQEVVAGKGPGAKPTFLLAIDGPSQHYKRWLVADDPARNRLLSYIGTWRYMAVADDAARDDLFAQFETELTRDPVLRVTLPDGGRIELPARAGTTREIEGTGCTVKVVEFYPQFGADKETNRPIKVSERRLNPAALVEMRHAGGTARKWIFAKFPGFRFHEEPDLPLRVVLDCPQEKQGTAPDFVVVSVGASRHEVWSRFRGESAARPLEVGEAVPILGSQYRFSMERFVPAGVLREDYRPGEGKGTVPVVRVESIDAAGKPVALWVELGKQRRIRTAKGLLSIVFHMGRREEMQAGHR